VQDKLSHIAAARGSDAEMLAREAIERFVDYDEWFIREVERAWHPPTAASCCLVGRQSR